VLIACIAIGLFAPFAALAAELEQQWTRQITDGVTYYHMRVRLDQGPAHLHILEISPQSGYTIKPAIANGKVGTLEPVSKLAKKVDAIAAINGGFFDTGSTRLPVGLIKMDFRTVFEQFLQRPVLGIDADGGIHFETFLLHSRLYLPDQETYIPLFGYNRPRKSGEIIAYTSDYGDSTKTNVWGRELLLKRLSPQEVHQGVDNYVGEKYLVVGEGVCNSPLGEDDLVLSIHSHALDKYSRQFSQLFPGSEVEIRTNVPAGWERFPYLLGGGPMLVKNGSYALNYRAERFSGAMNSPTARTAVGLSRSGNIMLIVVDAGSRDYSVGATWHQLATLGVSLLNVSDLMGFDGGGSSTMFVDNRVVNKPKGDAPRSVANIIAIVRKPRG
jgi:hypothetical protein